MKKVLPGIPETELTEIFAASAVGLERDTALLADAGNSDLADGVLDASDRTDFKSFVNTNLKQQAADATAFMAFLSATGLDEKCPSLAKNLGSSLSAMLTGATDEVRAAAEAAKKKRASEEVAGSSAPAPSLKPICGTDLAALRAMLPQVKGCVGQLYEESRRCQVYFPDIPAPHPSSRSRTWSARAGSGFSKAQVMKHCLHWAWAWHQRQGGGPCPSNLGRPLSAAFRRQAMPRNKLHPHQ